MGYQSNYGARNFSRGAKAMAFARSKDVAGVPRCKCGAILSTGNIHYDHIDPWEISRHSGPLNCQALCTTCHRLKTGQVDIPLIAEIDRVHDRHIGAWTPGHPMPCGRKSNLSKPIGSFRPVRRQTQAQKHRAAIERRYGAFIGKETRP